MSNINAMRIFVSEQYSGKGWKEKVAKMKDEQIVKLYYTFKKRGGVKQ